MKLSKSNQKGFTIIELIIASAVFSLMLLTASALIIQISRLYYKGTIISNTQTAARQLVDSISRPIQLENATVVGPIENHVLDADHSIYSICIGGQRISYVIGLSTGGFGYDASAAKIPHPVWIDEVPTPQDCTIDANRAKIEDPNPNYAYGTNGKDLLGPTMRLRDIDVSPATLEGLWNIRVGVIYGEKDLIEFDPATNLPVNCYGAVAGSQWCSSVTYFTKVFKRIKDGNN